MKKNIIIITFGVILFFVVLSGGLIYKIATKNSIVKSQTFQDNNTTPTTNEMQLVQDTTEALVDDTKTEIDNLNTQITTINSQLSSLDTKLTDNINILQNKISEQNTKISTLENKNIELERKITDSSNKIYEQNKEISTLKTKISNLEEIQENKLIGTWKDSKYTTFTFVFNSDFTGYWDNGEKKRSLKYTNNIIEIPENGFTLWMYQIINENEITIYKGGPSGYYKLYTLNKVN